MDIYNEETSYEQAFNRYIGEYKKYYNYKLYIKKLSIVDILARKKSVKILTDILYDDESPFNIVVFPSDWYRFTLFTENTNSFSFDNYIIISYYNRQYIMTTLKDFITFLKHTVKEVVV